MRIVLQLVFLLLAIPVIAQQTRVVIVPAQPRVGDLISIGILPEHCDSMPYEKLI